VDFSIPCRRWNIRQIGRALVSSGLAAGLGWLAAGVGLPAPAAAQSGEQGSVCVHDFAAGVTCSGTDVVAAELTVVSIDETCEAGDPDSALVTFDAVLSNSAADRYDIALFVALDGGDALDGGSCYHDYLDPPLTTTPAYPIENGPYANLEPFVPDDACGDMQSGTEVTKTLAAPAAPLRIDCADTNEDGNVDVSVCVAWRAGTTGQQSTCTDLSDALPTSSERCSCTRLELSYLPEPGPALSLASGAALLAVLAAHRSKHRRRG
jgi:hypothetical protein